MVSLPWKADLGPDKLLNNESLARNRLRSLSRRLNRDPELKLRYNSALKEMESANMIQEVVENNSGCVTHPVYYLPHHPVLKESSLTTKVRPVFDASAAGPNGVSLNDCLEPGPSLFPNLVEILIRFRRWRVALTADITKAFLQIGVRPEDQDVHRFLWDDDGHTRTMKFLRVPFGNTSSPFLLNATIKYHLSKFTDSKAVNELKTNLFVDDFLSGADITSECCQLYYSTKLVVYLVKQE